MSDRIEIAAGFATIGQGAGPLMVTWKCGLFSKYGLAVAMPRLMGGAQGVVRGLVSGEIEFGNMAAAAPLKANLRGEADLVFLSGGINQQFIMSRPGLTEREHLAQQVSVRIFTERPAVRDLIETESIVVCQIDTGSVKVGWAERVEQRTGIDRAIRHMHTHYAEKLVVADLAERAAMSVAHFARVFKEETGRPPLEYLRELRLEKARRLLRAAELPVTEIALRCGFGTSSHFAATFRRHCGTSARRYRASLLRSAPATKKERIAQDAAARRA